MVKRFRWQGIIALLLVMAVVVTFVGTQPTLGTAKAVKGGEFYAGKTPKYVFMFIGDGMSYGQVSSAEMYLGKTTLNAVYPQPKQLNFTQFPTHGALMTQDSSSFIPDSASTATSLASGQKTLSGVINMDETKTIKYRPITEDLKEMGYKIGVISSVPINHATPAAYYAKVPSRNNYDDIATQLAESGFDYFGGGSFLGNLENNLKKVSGKGYTIADTKEEILALNSSSGKVVAINPTLDSSDHTAMNYEIDRDKAAGELSLADFVEKGIDVLDNPKGFFMMVESGKIDWANHANDASASIHDTIAFGDAVQEALEFYQKHPQETLILVTADHETGGMTLGYANTGYSTYFEKLQPVTMSYVEFDMILNAYKKTVTPESAKLEDLLDEIKDAYGLIMPGDPDAAANPGMVLSSYQSDLVRAAFAKTMMDKKLREKNYTEQEKVLYGTYEPLTVTLSHIANNKAGLSYTSYSHTGLPVPVYATGVGAEMFEGFNDNTAVYYKLAAITKADKLIDKIKEAVGF